MNTQVKRGDRFEVLQDHKTSALTSWFKPYSGDFPCVIPKGTVLIAGNDQLEGVPGFLVVAEDYREMEEKLVPNEIRSQEKYAGFHFSFVSDDIGKILKPLKSENLAAEAQILRIARICGIIDENSVKGWADDKILKGWYDTEEILDLSTKELSALDCISKLRTLARDSDSKEAMKVVCAQLGPYLDKDIALALPFAEALYQIVLENDYNMPEGLSFLVSAQDDLYLGGEGVYGLEKEELRFVQSVRKFDAEYTHLFPRAAKLLQLKEIAEDEVDLNDGQRANLDRQLKMNKQTWAQLASHGVQDGAVLKVDYFFYSKTENDAKILQDYLIRFKKYNPRISFNNKEYCVQGETTKMKVGPKHLDAWVTWMVKAGARCNCEFDGWGTEASNE